MVKAMNIGSEKIDELAIRLTRLTGEDMETALARALEERISRITRPASADRQAAIRAFFDRASRMPVRDARPIDDIIGYGADGLPS